MKRKIVVRALSASLLSFQGCTSTYQVTSPPDREQSLKAFGLDAYDRTGMIVFRDGREVSARNMRATPDSLYFIPEGTNAITVMPTREVRKVVLKDHFMGLLEGFGWGALAGAATIVTVRAAVGGSKDVTSWDYFIIAAAIGGGGLLGGFPGLILGHTNECQFAPTRD